MRMTLCWVAVFIGLSTISVQAYTTDVELVEGNLGLTSCVWNAETILSPALALSPPRKTVASTMEIVFAVSGSTNPVTWFLTDNRSGATLNSYSERTAVYCAGPTSDCVDAVEVWDGVNSFGRSRVNVISSNEVARCGKAVIIAGRASSTDPVWPTTRYLANFGYNALRYKGFSRENTRYLSPVTTSDVDGDGLANDISGLSTRENVAATFTNWVGHADRLFVYLVDHGGTDAGLGFFRLNPDEKISAEELDNWLTALQEGPSKTEVTLVIDCCNAGSFLASLAYTSLAHTVTPSRVVIVSCQADQPTIFVAGGLVSFSEAFFSGLMLGLNVGEAFTSAKAAMKSYQNAGLDDTRDGLSGEADGAVAGGLTVGASFIAGKDMPHIGLVLGHQQLVGDTKATLWAGDVVSAYPIARVWCLIVPPGHQPDPKNPVTDLPQLDLSYNPSSGRYEAQYDGFSEEGVYKVMYYAKDIWDSVSLPSQSFVTQSSFMERAVIVAGGTTNDALWAAVDSISDYAYAVLCQRRLSTNAICYLSAQMKPGVDGLTDCAGLMSAVTNFAKGSNKLSLFMIGTSAGTNGAFRLNGAETYAARDFDGLLDIYQSSNASVTVVMDFDGAGGWVPTLAGANRVCVASTLDGQTASFRNQGVLSFSSFFFNYVFNGMDVWTSFYSARKKIRNATGRKQNAILDSDADGVYVAKIDQALARQCYLGSAFMTGADAPTIESVTPDTVLTNSNSLTLWAAGVADIGGISNVFCLVTQPGDDGFTDVLQTNLTWNSVTERYEVVYDGFRIGGPYACTFFALDNEGHLSMPSQTIVDVAGCDAYESDDSAVGASMLEIGVAQAHTLHTSNDVDWVKFYAPVGYVLEIQATQLGTNTDLRLDVYHEQANGTLLPVYEMDDDPVGEDFGETVELDLMGEVQEPSGFYLVRVCCTNESLWGVGSEYEFKVNVMFGAGNASVIVVVADKLDDIRPPLGTKVVWDGTNERDFGPTNSLLLQLSEGVHTIRVTTAPGYLPLEDPAIPEQVSNIESYWGNPKKFDVMAISDANSQRTVSFFFVPVIKAKGTVVDRFTGEPVAGAKLTFQANGGFLEGLEYDGYPGFAVYKSPWVTATDGTFPTNVWLPTSGYNLTISRERYANLTRNPAVTLLPAGTVTNFGTLYLSPVDLNSNGVGDGWEQLYQLTNVTASSDADADKSSDRNEYLAGTDPTNRLSVFQILEMIKSPAAGEGLMWNASGGRSYRVHWTDALDSWPAGQRVAVGPTNVWIDTTQPKPPKRFYRVGVELPESP